MQKVKNITFFSLKLALSVLLLYFAFNKYSLDNLKYTLENSNLILLVFACILLSLNLVLGAYRWSLFVNEKNEYQFIKVLKIYYIGHFLNTFVPSGIIGDVGKAFYLRNKNKSLSTSLATVINDRIAGLLILVLFAGFASLLVLLFVEKIKWILILAISCFFLIILMLFLYTPIPLNTLSKIPFPYKAKIINLLTNIRDVDRKILPKILIISLLNQFIMIISIAILGLSLEIEINIGYYFILIPIIGLITTIPISIGGLGIREWSYIYFFSKYNIAENSCLTLSLIFSLVLIINGVIGGVIYFLISYND